MAKEILVHRAGKAKLAGFYPVVVGNQWRICRQNCGIWGKSPRYISGDRSERTMLEARGPPVAHLMR